MLIITISSIIYGYYLNLNNKIYDENYDIIFKNISFSNGELIHNLYYNNQYFTENNNIIFFLQKTPAIPFLIFFLSLLSKNFFFIITMKNIIIFSFYFWLAYKVIASTGKSYLFFILISITPIIIPYNFGVSLNFVYEDCLIAIFLPILFLLVITNYRFKYLFIGLILFILYFVKTSVFLLVFIIPFLIIFFEKKIKIFIKTLPLLSSILAIFLWGYFGYSNTGRFPFGSTGASINSYVLSSVLNKEFKNYYPHKSTDLIPISKPNNFFKSEWEFYDYYNIKNKNYLKYNFSSYIEDIGLKLNFIFFGIRVDGVNSDNLESSNNPIRYSSIFSKFFFNLSIFISLYVLAKNYRNILNCKKEFYFIVILILNLIPHIVGWATSKHLVAISNVSLIYLIFFIKDKFYANSK